MNDTLTLDELRALLATIDLATAARALGLGRTKAYELAKCDQFPCRVLRIGSTYRVPTAELLRYLGIAVPPHPGVELVSSQAIGGPRPEGAVAPRLSPSSMLRPSGAASTATS